MLDMTNAADIFAAFRSEIALQTPLRSAITAAYRSPEPQCVPPLLNLATAKADEAARIRAIARGLVAKLRAKTRSSGVEGLIHEYSLSSQEGVALMCLAEALLRIPDAATRNALIRDKLSPGDWRAHVGQSPSLFVNAATWGLMLTGRVGDDDQRAGFVGGPDPPHRAQRGTHHSRRRRRRHAAHGRTVRHRTHHRRGDRK